MIRNDGAKAAEAAEGHSHVIWCPESGRQSEREIPWRDRDTNGGCTRRIPTHAPWRERASWALYDFANTIFSMNVATLYFSVWLIADLQLEHRIRRREWHLVHPLVLSVPLLGAVSDARRRRKPWVVGFTIVSCLACAAIGVLGQLTLPITGGDVSGTALPAEWHPTISHLRLGTRRVRDRQLRVSGRTAVLQRHAARPRAARGARPAVGHRHRGRICRHDRRPSPVAPSSTEPFRSSAHCRRPRSSLLRAMVPFSVTRGRVSTFVPTAMLFPLFSLPLFIFCHDHRHAWTVRRSTGARVPRRGHTLRDASAIQGALPFILASFLYQDAMGTIVSFMAIYAVKAMGFAEGTETRSFSC